MSETQPLLSSQDDKTEYDSLREENKPQMAKACSLTAVLSDSDQDAIKRLSYAMGFAFLFMAVEMVGGYIANSIAVLSDGAHLLSDVASYLISIYAIYASSKPADADYSWGYKRSEIMGAIASVLMIWAITGWLVVEAIQRFFTPSDVNGGLMLTVAVLGVVVNGSMGLILTMKGHGHSHGLGGHGDSCGGHGSKEHGHSNASNDQENNHGHSHASNDQGHVDATCHDKGHSHTSDHGHSHAKVSDHENSATCSDHGHSHAKSDDAHSHAKSDDAHSHAKSNHGHSHAKADHGHSHADHAPYVEETVLDLSDDAYEHVEAESLNLRAAYLHVLGDLVQSMGVVISGFLIWMDPVTFWWADPVCTLVFAVIVVYTTVSIVRDVFEVMMMAVPKHINIDDMRRSIYNCDTNITQVHCLHVWALSPSVVAMTCTIDVEDRGSGITYQASESKQMNSKSICSESVLIKVKEMVRTKFGISHSSLEVRNPDHCMNSPRPENCVRRDNSTSNLANISL